MPNKSKKQGPKITKRFGSTIANQLYANSFPREMKTTMRYRELVNFTATTSVANDRVFMLNSIYDPYSTGTGHQPQGHDQWANFYNRYRVDGATATLRYSMVSSSQGIYATVLGNNSSTAITDYAVASESPHSTSGLFASGGSALVLTRSFNLADLNGVTRQVYEADDRYQSTFGGNPTEVLALHIVTTDLQLSNVQMAYIVEIDYDVTLFDPIQLALS